GFAILVDCKYGTKTVFSCPLIDKAHDVNRRIVFSMTLLGVGLSGLSNRTHVSKVYFWDR
ncbi:hypothetical protein WH47_06859, partial [Habropoda laboriosa]